MIRILLDQGLPRTACSHLQKQGWDVLHTGDIGLSKAKDNEILQHARDNNRVIITLDSDFHAYLAVTNAASPSVIRIRIEGLNGEALAELLQNVWPRITQDLQQGAMVTITEKAIRIHSLPAA